MSGPRAHALSLGQKCSPTVDLPLPLPPQPARPPDPTYQRAGQRLPNILHRLPVVASDRRPPVCARPSATRLLPTLVAAATAGASCPTPIDLPAHPCNTNVAGLTSSTPASSRRGIIGLTSSALAPSLEPRLRPALPVTPTPRRWCLLEVGPLHRATTSLASPASVAGRHRLSPAPGRPLP
jgi:hypothetical protein